MDFIFKLKKSFQNYYKKNLFIIVFLGPDGSGKSSLITELMIQYKSTGLNYHSHIYPNLNNKFVNKNCYPYSRKPYTNIISNFKVIYMVLKNLLSYCFTLLLKKKEKTIIWCDRYIYDIFADPKRYRLKKIFLTYDSIKRLSFSPDLIFILNPPIKSILKRSSEISKEELINQSKNYNKLSKLLPESVLIKQDDSIIKILNNCKYYIDQVLYK